jgi:hypothetical protein
MAWSVEFIPNEATDVTVNINNTHWTTWHSSDGHVNWLLSAQWVNLPRIHIYAAANPRGRNASLRVLWDGNTRQVMDFDNDEDHDVDNGREPRLLAAEAYVTKKAPPKAVEKPHTD